MAIQPTNVGQVQRQNEVQVQDKEKNKDVGDKQGVIAKGVGMFKKMWLHLTGKAGNRHSQQLTNLRAQVKTKFGDDGLTHLNKALQDKGFTTNADIKKDTSTKLLSDGEIKDLMSTVEVEKRVASRMDDIASDAQNVLDNSKLLDALHKFTKKEFSSENVEFFMAMKDLSKRDNVPLDDVIKLYDNFVAKGSKQEINIPDKQSKKLKEKFESLKTAMDNDDNTAIDKTKKELMTELKGANKTIVDLIERDTMMRAPNDPDFKKTLHDFAYDQIKNEVIKENLEKMGFA